MMLLQKTTQLNRGVYSVTYCYKTIMVNMSVVHIERP